MDMSVYNGIYIRDTLNDTGAIPSEDVYPTYSPDVICFQGYTLTWYSAKENYEKNINLPFIQNNINNIYIRAKNIGDKPLASKVRAYYANLNIMFEPSKWNQLKTSRGETDVDLACNMGSTMIPPGEVALSGEAYWLNRIRGAELHTCMFGLCQDENGDWPQLPDHFKNNADMWNFLRYHPNIAYNNIQIEFAKDGVVNLPVEFGNHDPVSRKFILAVTVTEGLGLLAGGRLNIQCTDMACTFSNSQDFEHGRDCYLYEYEVPAGHFSSMDVTCVLKSPETVDCKLQIENYLIIGEDEKVIIPTTEITHTRSGIRQKATKVGDFLLVIEGGEKTDDKIKRDGAGPAIAPERLVCLDGLEEAPVYNLENGLRHFTVDD